MLDDTLMQSIMAFLIGYGCIMVCCYGYKHADDLSDGNVK